MKHGHWDISSSLCLLVSAETTWARPALWFNPLPGLKYHEIIISLSCTMYQHFPTLKMFPWISNTFSWGFGQTVGISNVVARGHFPVGIGMDLGCSSPTPGKEWQQTPQKTQHKAQGEGSSPPPVSGHALVPQMKLPGKKLQPSNSYSTSTQLSGENWSGSSSSFTHTKGALFLRGEKKGKKKKKRLKKQEAEE